MTKERFALSYQPKRTNSSVGGSRNMARYYGRGREWATPPDLFALLDEEFHFTLDPCAAPANAKCEKFFTEFDNGLSRDWGVDRVFMNPPWGREIPLWTAKAVDAARKGALVVGLLPAATDADWWHRDIVDAGAEIRYLRGRVRYIVGDKQSVPWQPSVVIVWRSFGAAEDA